MAVPKTAALPTWRHPISFFYTSQFATKTKKLSRYPKTFPRLFKKGGDNSSKPGGDSPFGGNNVSHSGDDRSHSVFEAASQNQPEPLFSGGICSRATARFAGTRARYKVQQLPSQIRKFGIRCTDKYIMTFFGKRMFWLLETLSNKPSSFLF